MEHNHIDYLGRMERDLEIAKAMGEISICTSCGHTRNSHKHIIEGHPNNHVMKCTGDEEGFCSCIIFESGMSNGDIKVTWKK